MYEMIWKKFQHFISLFIPPFQKSKSFDGASEQASDLLFVNLKSLVIGEFETEQDSNLDSAIRLKQMLIFNQLEMDQFDSFLEIGAEWGLLSRSFASQFAIMATAVFQDEVELNQMQQLSSTFPSYQSIRAVHLNNYTNNIDYGWFNAVYLSNSFFESCSYFQWTSTLAIIRKKLEKEGRVFVELFTRSKNSTEFIKFILFSIRHGHNTTILHFFSIKYIIHMIYGTGFQVNHVRNVSKNAGKTIKCYLNNIRRQQTNLSEKEQNLIRYYELKMEAIQSGSISGWNLLLSSNEQ